MRPNNQEIHAELGAGSLSWFARHTFFTMLIVGAVSAFMLGVVQNAAAAWLDAPISFGNILFWGFVFSVGLIPGYFVNKAMRIRASSWIWVLGLGWLVFGIHGALRSYDPRWQKGCTVTQTIVNAFLVGGHKCGGGEDALYGLLFTVPTVGLVGCSVGSWIALRGDKRDDTGITPVHSAQV